MLRGALQLLVGLRRTHAELAAAEAALLAGGLAGVDWARTGLLAGTTDENK
jgi:hypothetical protein